jgi:ComF family protein
MFQKFGKAIHAALDLLYPPRCAACDLRLSDEDAIFCELCARLIEPIISACPRCALPWPQPLERPPPCINCLVRPPRVEAAFAPYEFGGAIADAVRRLKWGSLPEVARPLGRLLADGLARAGPSFSDVDVVVPVPLHPKRLRSREFNQATLLAQVMAATLAARERSPWPLRVDPLALVRLRDTPPQTQLSRKQRRQNVLDAFAVPQWARDRVREKRVLLVDDVLTTGATADACAAALYKAGAKAVLVLTLGRAMT